MINDISKYATTYDDWATLHIIKEKHLLTEKTLERWNVQYMPFILHGTWKYMESFIRLIPYTKSVRKIINYIYTCVIKLHGKNTWRIDSKIINYITILTTCSMWKIGQVKVGSRLSCLSAKDAFTPPPD